MSVPVQGIVNIKDLHIYAILLIVMYNTRIRLLQGAMITNFEILNVSISTSTRSFINVINNNYLHSCKIVENKN